MNIEEVDMEAFVLEVDPDWTDHFLTIDAAFYFYVKGFTGKETDEVLNRLEEQKQHWSWQQDHDENWIRANL